MKLSSVGTSSIVGGADGKPRLVVRVELRSPPGLESAMNDWVVSRIDVLGGKPHVRDTRLSVEFVRELIASGATDGEILARYPQVAPDALAAIKVRSATA